MKIIKKLIIGIVVTISILTLFSCAVNKNNGSAKLFNAQSGRVIMEEAVEDFAYETEAPYAYTGAASLKAKNTSVTTAYGEESLFGSTSDDRKLIKYVSIQSETKEFDTTIDWLKKEVKNFKGVVDNFYLDLGNKTNPNFKKSGNFSIRVPFDKLEDFIKKVSEKVNITYHNENIEDVTDNYNETHSRLMTLRIEEKKLNELMEKATNIADVIALEEKLSDVRNQIQRIESRIKNYDKQIIYSTININIIEVKDLTEAIEKENYSSENIMKQLTKNFEATKKFLINAGVYIFTHIPSILLTILILIVVILILSGIVRFIFRKPNEKIKINAEKNVAIKNENDSMDKGTDAFNNNQNVTIEEIK